MTRSLSFPAREEPPAVEVVDSIKVACSGADAASAHPRVFLKMKDGHAVDCPYCGRRFVLREGAASHGEH